MQGFSGSGVLPCVTDTVGSDELVVADLYDSYSDIVFRTCRAILLDHHDAEDAAQEVFAKLLARAPGQAIGDPRSWLLEVTRNHCFDRLRASARRPTVPAGRLPCPRAEDAEQRSLLRAHVRWLLALLPRRQREAMVRQAVLDEDLDTVAARLGISYGAAALLMHRARRALLHANDSAGAGIAVAGTKLAELGTRLRELAWRGIAAGRELVGRGPLDTALALPFALLVALLGATPGAAPHQGAPAAPAMVLTAASGIAPQPAPHIPVIAPAATALRARVAAPPSPAPSVKVTPPSQLRLPPTPQGFKPLLHNCRQVAAQEVCPPVLPSAVPLPSLTIGPA